MSEPISVVVADPAGLHARPAGAVAGVAAGCGDDEIVLLRHAGHQADARSVLEMLSLGICSGSIVEIVAPEYAARKIEEILGSAPDSAPEAGAPEISAPEIPAPVVGPASPSGTPAPVPAVVAPSAEYPLWAPRLIARLDRAADAADAVRQLGERLISLGAIDRGYLDATIERERVQPTGIPADPPFAIAHSEAEGVHRLSLAIGVFAEPVSFGRMDDPSQNVAVRTVALLAVPHRSHHVSALKSVIDLLVNAGTAERLSSAADEQAMWGVLSESAPGLVDPALAEHGGSRVFGGRAVSSGVAVAPARLLGDPETTLTAVIEDLDDAAVEAELVYLERVLADASARWRTEAGETDGEQADIMRMYAAMASDPALRKAAETRIRRGARLAAALAEAAEEHARTLRAVGDEYLTARADDVRGVARALSRLAAAGPQPGGAGPCVVVGRSLTVLDLPADTVVAGIADAAGSTTSHLGMVAQARGIPAVFGLGDGLLSGVQDGETVLLDGWNGAVEIEPAADRVAALLQTDAERRARADETAVAAAGITGTRDGTAVEFAANAADIDGIREAIAAGADGIGLLRTELAFGEFERRPSRAQQRAFFADAIDAVSGRRLVVRTFDFGTDKPARFLPVTSEQNPALGVRGLRLHRSDPELIAEQVGALADAVHDADADNVAVMAPMVTTVDEARAFRELVRSADPAGRLQIGVMVEVPSLLFLADEIAEVVDFLSVGTNDLTQYLMAADRLSPALADLHDPGSPALLRAVDTLCAAARRAGIWVGVCGEAASDPAWAALAVGMGVSELSVRLDRLAEVKVAVGGLTIDEAGQAAREALGTGSAPLHTERKN